MAPGLFAWAAVAGLFGLAVGSFLNVVADRVPAGQSILSPPSHCPGCGRRLAAAELVPVVSYLWRRGRCHTCGRTIGRRTLFLELAGGAIAALAVLLFGPSPAAALAMLWGWLFLTLSVIDVERRRAPNVLVLPALGLALLSAPWSPLAGGLSAALLGAAVLGLPWAVLYLAAARWYGEGKGLGLGDVKVAFLTGLIAGWPAALAALYGAVVSGGLTALLLLAGRRWRRSDAVPSVPFFALGLAAGLLWRAALLNKG